MSQLRVAETGAGVDGSRARQHFLGVVDEDEGSCRRSCSGTSSTSRRCGEEDHGANPGTVRRDFS
jgi:hypothetical protein